MNTSYPITIPGGVFLNNGYARATVAPGLARVLQFEAPVGRDWFWVNRGQMGRVYSPAEAGQWIEWPNPGGARTEIAPQAQWRATEWRKDWPMPPGLGCQRKLVLPSDPNRDRVFLKTAENFLGLNLDTGIELMPRSTLVRVETTIRRHSRMSAHTVLPWANWLTIQIASGPQTLIYVPPHEVSRFGPGYATLMAANPEQMPVMTGDPRHDVSVITYNRTQWKFGFDGRSWLAVRAHPDDAAVFVLMQKLSASLLYPDDGCSMQLYTAGHEDYVEIEALGPLTAQDRTDCFWFGATNCIGPIVAVSEYGVTAVPLGIRADRLTGRFGVFCQGTAVVKAIYNTGAPQEIAKLPASPDRSLVIDSPLAKNRTLTGARVYLHSGGPDKKEVLLACWDAQ